MLEGHRNWLFGIQECKLTWCVVKSSTQQSFEVAGYLILPVLVIELALARHSLVLLATRVPMLLGTRCSRRSGCSRSPCCFVHTRTRLLNHRHITRHRSLYMSLDLHMAMGNQYLFYMPYLKLNPKPKVWWSSKMSSSYWHLELTFHLLIAYPRLPLLWCFFCCQL